MYSTSLKKKCHTLFMWTNADKWEEVSEAVWPLKVRFKSSVTPRSLTEVTGTRSWTRKGMVMLLGNLEISYLTPERTNCFSFRIDQKVVSVIPLWNVFKSSATWRRHESMSFDVNDKYILVSSTQDLMLLNLMTLGRSFIHRLKSVRPRIEPWGMPCVIVSGSDIEVATRVDCCLFVR